MSSSMTYKGYTASMVFDVEDKIITAARETGRDPVLLRRQNLIPTAAMPYRAPSGRLYDSGECEAVLGSMQGEGL